MKTKKILLYVVLIVVAILMSFPFIWILSNAFKSYADMSAYPPELIPNNVTLDNFKYIFEQSQFGLYARNTTIIVAIGTLGTLISSPIVAFALARMDFKGKNMIFAMILSTMMVPVVVTIIPQFFIFSKVNMIDSLLPMIIPTFFAAPYNVFLFRQFFITVPKELDEAAMIDGCSWWQIFYKVHVPIAKPVFITVGVLSAIFWWNEYFLPLVYSISDSSKTLTLGTVTAFYFSGSQGVVQWNLQMALCVLLVIPPIVLYMFAQKHIDGGIKTTGGK